LTFPQNDQRYLVYFASEALTSNFFSNHHIMPIYAYKCTNCGFEHDYLQKVSDAPRTKCPECGKDTLVKELSAPGFELKGSGWAATDFNGGHKALPASHTKPKS
jgi:putative regulatory protein, fmdB family